MSMQNNVVIGDDNTLTDSKQINNNIDITQTTQDIKALLEEFSEEFNATSAKGQNKIKDAIITDIQTKPDLKTRLHKALKAAGEQTLIETVNHPAARVTIKGLKAFFEK